MDANAGVVDGVGEAHITEVDVTVELAFGLRYPVNTSIFHLNNKSKPRQQATGCTKASTRLPLKRRCIRHEPWATLALTMRPCKAWCQWYHMHATM